MRACGLAFVATILLGCARTTGPRDPTRDAIAAAARLLWSRQAPDGGWHSETYGLLKSGQSLSPFILRTLLRVPADLAAPPEGAVDRALAFIRGGIDRDGAVGRRDPTIDDYPNYATSLAARALARAGARDYLGRLLDCLRRQQFSEAGGWAATDAPYGGWGMGGAPRTPPNHGHLDLSMTRHVLQGLREGGLATGDPAFVRALAFLDRCRNADGSFFFSPAVLDANKAGRDGERPRGYGTTTCDGLLALLAAGAAADDPRVKAAGAWIVRNHRVDRVPGFPEEITAPWTDGMIHYYWAASASALDRLEVAEAPAGRDWRKDLVGEILRRRHPDGTWTNPVFLMKEDDPLIATTFALSALLSAGRIAE